MEWQPIETAPKDGSAVLAFYTFAPSESFVETVYWDRDRGEWVIPCECETSMARPRRFYTHWMPLPEPPAP